MKLDGWIERYVVVCFYFAMGQTSNLSRGSGIFRYCILLTLGIFILTASACSCCNIVWSFVTVMLNPIEKGEDGADCIKIAHFCGSSEMPVCSNATETSI